MRKADQKDINGTKLDSQLSNLMDVILESGAETVHYECSGFDLAMLHSFLAVAARHAEVKELPRDGQRAIWQFRVFCRKHWMARGLTEKEAKYLDDRAFSGE